MIAERALLASAALLAAGCGPVVWPEVRSVALGDSITGTLDSDTWPRFFVDLLDISDEALAAEGSGGRTVIGGFERLNEILDLGTYPDATVLIYFLGGADVIEFIASIDPALTTAVSDGQFMFGDALNALLDDVHTVMLATLELAQAASLDIYVATYFSLPADVAPCEALSGDVLSSDQAERVNEYVALLNEVISDVAVEFGATLVDLRLADEALMGPPAHFADCTHPSERGAEIIAARFAGAFLTD
ncbi:MAG: SGNH/GDSL hydrolase family protein [Planctomycetes bacterium]|nr:SGNH/GDSL hydrolase family protein [Planctomycetota bacterium]